MTPEGCCYHSCIHPHRNAPLDFILTSQLKYHLILSMEGVRPL